MIARKKKFGNGHGDLRRGSGNRRAGGALGMREALTAILPSCGLARVRQRRACRVLPRCIGKRRAVRWLRRLCHSLLRHAAVQHCDPPSSRMYSTLRRKKHL